MINLIGTIVRTFIIYCIVGVSVRLMGKRQLGELQPGELVITILISEIAATPITDNSVPLINGVLPLLLLVSFEIITSVLSRKSIKFRYIADGRPITVIKDGKLQQSSLKTLRFTIDDILAALRQKDVFNIDDVEYAIAETNGTLSILLKEPYRNLTLEAYEGKQKDGGASIAVIINGAFIDKSIKESSVTREEIERKIQREKVNVKDIILLAVDKNKKYSLIIKERKNL